MSASFEEAIQPLLDAHAALEADITEREAELAKLRDKAKRLRTAVRAVAPERLSKQERKTPVKFSEQAVRYVSDFLHDKLNGAEFRAIDVLRHDDYEGVRSKTLPAILKQLHQDGMLRLVRTGKGSSRYYEVIR